MKKIILPALMIGLLTACTDEKTDSEKSAKSLTGKWQMIKYEEYVGNDLEDSELIEEQNNSCPDYTEFKADGSMVYTDMGNNCEHLDDDLGVYTFDGSTLKVTTDEENEDYKVTSLTTTEFVIEDTYSEDGVTYKDIVYFKKLN